MHSHDQVKSGVKVEKRALVQTWAETLTRASDIGV
jgi:hypothetical protein